MADSETVAPASARSPPTIHYYGIVGAKGTRPSPLTGNYPHTGNTTANHGGISTSGLLYRNYSAGFRDCTDGLSNTLLVGELSSETSVVSRPYRAWTQGASTPNGDTASYACKNIQKPISRFSRYTSADANYLFNDVAMGSQHVGGTHFLLGDGTVRFLSENIDFGLYQSLASRDQGEVVTLD